MTQKFLDPRLVQVALDSIGNKFASVEFAKKSGEITKRRVRFHVTSRMAETEKSDAARERMARNGLVPFVDLDKEGAGWRSFSKERVTRIAGNGEVWESK